MGTIKKSVIVLLVLIASAAQAGPFTLPVLDASQADSVMKTMAVNTVFRPLQGADTFGNIFGLALGVTAQMTSTGPIANLVGSGTASSTSYLVATDVNAAVQLPFGLGVELGFLPNLNMSGTAMTRFGGAIKWTMTKSVLDMLPFAVAVRGLYTTTSISYTQNITGGIVNVGYNSNMYGIGLSVSKSLVFVEPYISYSLISHSSSLTGTGTATLFGGTGIPVGTTSLNGSGTAGFFQLGAEFKLFVLTVAAEYGSLFGADTYAARVGFKF